MPKQYANLTKNSSIPDVAGGVLWQDEVNKVFWLYGGEFAAAPMAFELWGYDVILNQWNMSSPSITSTSPIQRVSYGAGLAVSEIGRGFYYGGYLNNMTNPLWNGPQSATNNLIIFDMDVVLGGPRGRWFTFPLRAPACLYISGELPFPMEMGPRLGCVVFFISNIALEDSN